MTELEKLVRHNIWANQAWIDTLEAGARDDTYVATMVSHLLLGEQAWFQRIRGGIVDRNIWTAMTPVEIQTLQARHVAFYEEQLAGDLTRLVPYERFGGQKYRSPISDILLHLCTHGAHHRGQLAAYASGRDLAKPDTDFIDYCMAHGL